MQVLTELKNLTINADQPKEIHDFSQFPASEELEINMEPPTRDDKAINLLKGNKAPGIDNISQELLNGCQLAKMKKSIPDMSLP